MREGYTFDGWDKEPECRTEWDFEKDTLPKFGSGGELEGGTEAIYRVGILPISAEFFLIVHGKSLLFQPVALVLIVSYIFR